MKWAIDSTTEKIVAASDATSESVRYLCPNCRRNVFKAGSIYQAWHFRHQFGSFAEDCPEYHAGGSTGLAYYQYPAITLRGDREADHLTAPELFFVRRGEESRGHWQLFLIVPNDQNYVRCSIGDVRGWRPPMQWIADIGWKFPVSPQENPYSIICDKGSDTHSFTVDALKETNNLFSLSSYYCQRVRSDVAIVAGREYVFLTNSPKNIGSCDGIEFLTLNTYDAWRAVRFRLKLPSTQSAKDWCTTTLNRSVAIPKERVTVIFPPKFHDTDVDDSVYQPIFEISNQRGFEKPFNFTVRSSTRSFSLTNPVRGNSGTIVSCEAESHASQSVFLSNWESGDQAPVGIVIPTVRNKGSLVEKTIHFIFKNGPTGESIRSSIFDPRIEKHWASFFDGELNLVGIDISVPIPVTIETNEQRHFHEPKDMADWNATAYGAQLLSLLTSIKSTRPKWLRLDFGAFGNLQFLSEVATQERTSSYSFTRRHINRLRWLSHQRIISQRDECGYEHFSRKLQNSNTVSRKKLWFELGRKSIAKTQIHAAHARELAKLIQVASIGGKQR